MAKSAKDLTQDATAAFYAEDWVGVENVMVELETRFPATAARLRGRFEDIIFEREYLDDVGSIEL